MLFSGEEFGVRSWIVGKSRIKTFTHDTCLKTLFKDQIVLFGETLPHVLFNHKYKILHKSKLNLMSIKDVKHYSDRISK